MEYEVVFNLFLSIVFSLGVFLLFFSQVFISWERKLFSKQTDYIESLPNYFYKNSHLLQLRLMKSANQSEFTILFYRIYGIALISIAVFFFLNSN